jgi:hypothetical protein
MKHGFVFQSPSGLKSLWQNIPLIFQAPFRSGIFWNPADDAAPTGLCPSPIGWEKVAAGRVRVLVCGSTNMPRRQRSKAGPGGEGRIKSKQGKGLKI